MARAHGRVEDPESKDAVVEIDMKRVKALRQLCALFGLSARELAFKQSDLRT